MIGKLRVAAILALFPFLTLASPDARSAIVTAVEYVGDHVFLTANPAEIAALDSGQIPGWSRTGVEFRVNDSPDDGWVPVCRFYSPAFAPRSAHLLTAFAAECAALKANPLWIDEGVAFYAKPVQDSGSCPHGGTIPVYRWYNGGRGGVPQHKFTSVRSDTIGFPNSWEEFDVTPLPHGWVAEGVSPRGNAFCTAFTPPRENLPEPAFVPLLRNQTWTFTSESATRTLDLSQANPEDGQVRLTYSAQSGLIGIAYYLGNDPAADLEVFIVTFVGRDTLEGCRYYVGSMGTSACEFVVGRRVLP